ncbi:MAG: hypothetical protein QOF84_1706 [Streptomyces sp.]|jgi:hypothetical protein|nr:hypothetical protein [Streptomyces sp.]
MSQYLILIYGDEASWDGASPEFVEQLHKEHAAFQQANAGAVRAGEALHRTGTATSIRKDAGGVTVTDGPFAETKEALGGFYLVEAADLDAAIAVAQQVPAPFGGVEVRPIRTIDFG